MERGMKAAIYRGIGELHIESVPIPKLEQPNDVLIKVLLCSICGTDVHMMNVPPTFEAKQNTILGHEIVGIVSSVGSSVTSVKIGDRVVINPNENCEVCKYCRLGRPNHCTNMKAMGITHDGGFAEYVKTAEKQVFPISSDLSDKHAVFAEPLACAINGYSLLGIKPLSEVVIIGCGPIGLMFAMYAKFNGAHVICVEPNASRSAVSEKLGFSTADPYSSDIEQFTLKSFGSLADYVIDAAG